MTSATSEGNDLFRAIPSPVTGQPLEFTYWDFWPCLLVTADYQGDWNGLLEPLRRKRDGHQAGYDAAEAVLSHIRWLREALDQAELTATDVLADADPAFLKKQLPKARRKLREGGFREQEKSAWMLHTPRREREARARRGYWDRFPVSPTRYARGLEGLYKSDGFYSENQSFALERKLSAFLAKHEARVTPAEPLALYRAFLTVCLEKIEMVDDSYGVIGDLYGHVFEKYARLAPDVLGMPPELFLQDLLELLIWEDYGFTDSEQPAFFAGLPSGIVSLAEAILHEQRMELQALELDYQAEKALTMLGLLYTGQQMFDRFVPLAQIVGTRAWQRITTMAELAEQHGLGDLARAVYEACLGPGPHEAFLRKKYAELSERLSEKT